MNAKATTWKLAVTVLTLTCLLVPDVKAQSTSDVKELFDYLFTTNGYNKKIRPADDQTLPTDVSLDFYLSSIISFDEQEESLTTSGYLVVEWVDPDLQWTSTLFNGIENIFLPQDDIWKPDISLRNTVKSLTGLGSSYLNCYIESDGSVNWSPLQVLTSTCSVDITYFPFDIQSCSMKFVTWSYRKHEVNISVGTTGIDLSEYETNSAWDLIDTSDEGIVESDESAVIYNMKLKRKPLFFLLNIVIPILLLSILSVFTFALPLDSGERASYGITVFLSLAVFLTIVSSTLPQNSDKTSLLGIYLMLMTGSSTVIVLITLVQVRLAARDVKEIPINKLWLALHRFSGLLQNTGCCHQKTNVSDLTGSDDVTRTIPEKEPKPVFVPESEPEVDWKSLMVNIDYLGFWFFLLLTVLCTVILFSVSAIGSTS